uniref:Uncharacterized protein n=1 Tax=Octopus bimaculoides TaxID=37653 RepID=A0A0L8G2T3_OCTBM
MVVFKLFLNIIVTLKTLYCFPFLIKKTRQHFVIQVHIHTWVLLHRFIYYSYKFFSIFYVAMAAFKSEIIIVNER